MANCSCGAEDVVVYSPEEALKLDLCHETPQGYCDRITDEILKELEETDHPYYARIKDEILGRNRDH